MTWVRSSVTTCQATVKERDPEAPYAAADRPCPAVTSGPSGCALLCLMLGREVMLGASLEPITRSGPTFS